jgi:hypothetical protein
MSILSLILFVIVIGSVNVNDRSEILKAIYVR